MTVNKAILIGNVGADPEVRAMTSGDSICTLSVATSERWKDKNSGEQKEATEWHRVVLFGKLAEIAESYITKGSTVYIEGKIKTRKWTDKEGVDRYTTEIHAETMRMLGTPQGGRQQADDSGTRQQNAGKGQQRGQQQQRGNQGGGQRRPAPNYDDMDSDIPF